MILTLVLLPLLALALALAFLYLRYLRWLKQISVKEVSFFGGTVAPMMKARQEGRLREYLVNRPLVTQVIFPFAIARSSPQYFSPFPSLIEI